MSDFVATDKAIQFEKLEVYMDQELGSGAYGEVFRAKCDHLPCAAKVFQIRSDRSADWQEKMSRNNFLSSSSNTSVSEETREDVSLQNFTRECDILKRMQHPCIIQYLGMASRPDSGHVAVLMELANQNLTRMLHSCSRRRRPLPVRLQLHFNRDIALALAYLHQNHVMHRDISSHNILVVGRSKMKVSDFGTAVALEKDGPARLSDPIPGTEAYMPPEAFPISASIPVSYSFKLDIFAFGVLSLQIATGKFPRPGPATRKIEVAEEQVGTAERAIAEKQQVFMWKTVSEAERRKSHLDMVVESHPLLQLVLQCIMNHEASRPSADFICHELERIIRSKRLTEVDSAMDDWLENQAAAHYYIDSSSSSNEISATESDERFRSFPGEQKEGYSLDRGKSPSTLSTNSASYIDIMASSEPNQKWSLAWREMETRATEKIKRGDCISHKNNIIVIWNRVISCYKQPSNSWEVLSRNAYLHSNLAIIHGHLTTVGGRRNSQPRKATNLLRSLSKERKWVARFPAMPTKRYSSCTVQFDTGLVVAGGKIAESPNCDTDAVEILSFETLTWAHAAPFPRAFSGGSMVLNDCFLFAVGEQSLYQCSLGDLMDSTQTDSIKTVLQKQWTALRGTKQQQRTVWSYSSHCPLHNPSLASIRGDLIVIGGTDKKRKPCTSVHRYDMWTQKWEEVRHMGVARYHCLVGTVPEDSPNNLVVIGGCGSDHAPCRTIEIADIAVSSHCSMSHGD